MGTPRLDTPVVRGVTGQFSRALNGARTVIHGAQHASEAVDTMCHCISIAGRVKTEVLEAGVRSRRFEVCNQTVAQVDEGVFNPSFIGGWEHCCHSYIPSEAQISAYPVDSVIVTTLGDSPLTSDFAGEANIPADVLSRKGQVNIPDFQLSKDDSLFCGRTTDDAVRITALSGHTFTKLASLFDEDKITSYAVSTDNTVLFVYYFCRSQEPHAEEDRISIYEDHQSLAGNLIWKSLLTVIVLSSSTDFQNGREYWRDKIGYKFKRQHCAFVALGPQRGLFCYILLRFHPDGPYLFSSALGDYNVVVWNTETGAKLGSLDGHQSQVTGLCFNDDGNSIVTCGRDKVIMLWSCPEFQRRNIIPAFESLEACVFLPTGALINHLGESVRSEQLLLTGGQWGCLRVWHPTTGRCLLEVKGPLDRAPVTADGTVLTSKDRESIDYGLHSIVDLQLAHVLPTPDSSTSSGSPTDLLPKLILVRQSNHVEFYDPMIAKLTAEFLGDIGQVDQLCIVGKSHNHLLLADASPHLKLFVNPCGLSACSKEMDKGGKGSWSCHLVPGGHEDVITDLTVSTCGQWIVSGSKDQSLCLWQVVDRDLTLPGKGPLTKVVLVNRLLNAHSAHISAVCFNKSTNLLVSSADDNVLKAWTIKFDKPDVQKTANFHNVELAEWSVVHNAHQACVNAIDVSVNDQLVATASRDKTVKVSLPHVCCPPMSHMGREAQVTASRDKTVKIWTVTKTGLDCFGVLQGHRRGVWSVCFSAREKVVLTASGDGDVRLWNLKDFSCIRTFEGHEQPVYKAVFLSNDRQILSCDQKGLVRLWNVSKPGATESSDSSTGCKVFEAHEGRIWSIAVCPDESGFYTGGEDETLCYFKDVTQQIVEERSKKQEEFIQTRQILDNLIQQKQFAEALRLSVTLDQPKRTLDLLQDLLLMDEDMSQKGNNKMKSLRYSGHVAKLETALNGLLRSTDPSKQFHDVHSTSSEHLVQRLLTYAINWNTRVRTSVIAQAILNWIVTTWTPEELLRWPGIARTVESLLPYTVRHYQRVSRLEEQLAILDYLCDVADEHQVGDIAESIDPAQTPDVVDLNLSVETECELRKT
ncbi:hypothetical protein T265_01758 [Opisthorchis viverrini]|uniref:U3 small nucleolar RNA-associated protein 13 C-terminal domain-containing protein n=1 Tax=Opisthorchis viverrini TaxID=6198 RepID=A0A074ZXG6_OPIVI|nr:hypothetical protein T265_01758 [Opisthorchis viverrini]KER32138.1 hypothetical protein T265_01758 [Opisthorchis viverrini]